MEKVCFLIIIYFKIGRGLFYQPWVISKERQRVLRMHLKFEIIGNGQRN